jgi:aspartyl-tRNA(Asn)/glutamyl-tRNA(Gln) amidotransferase subunit C
MRLRRDNTASPLENPYFRLPGRPSYTWFQCFAPAKFPMSLTALDIERIANLSRLELRPDESARMLVQLNGFFDIVEQMRAVDTRGVEPLAHPVDMAMPQSLRLRQDLASEPDRREANQKSAPAVERGLFLVPRVIE